MEFPISFKWERKGDEPTKGKGFASNSVVLNGEVYLEGLSDGVIHQYTPARDTWTEFQKPTLTYAIAALNGKLILLNNDGVMTWNSEAHKWVYDYPTVPTQRVVPAVVGYKSYVIVAGGYPDDRVFQSTTAVELLDTDSGKWYKAPPMPYNGCEIKSVVIGQHLYLQFGTRGSLTMSKSILKVSLPTLISHTFAGKNRDTSVWEKLPDVPFYNSTLFSIGNMLLSAGGSPTGTAGTIVSAMKIQSYKIVSDIYLFNPFTDQWVKVGDLPEPRSGCECIAYSPGSLLLVGGYVDLKKPTSAIYTATISRFHF